MYTARHNGRARRGRRLLTVTTILRIREAKRESECTHKISNMNRIDDDVRSLKDIRKESLEQIFRSHYRRQDVKITEDSDSELKQFEGNNDFYNSQIRKFSVKVCYTNQ